MLCPEELATVTTAAAIGLAQGRSTEEVGILSAVFTQIGDVLATIAVQRAAVEACCEKKCPQTASKSDDNAAKSPVANMDAIT